MPADAGIPGRVRFDLPSGKQLSQSQQFQEGASELNSRHHLRLSATAKSATQAAAHHEQGIQGRDLQKMDAAFLIALPDGAGVCVVDAPALSRIAA
jgi:hypothetical protein